MPNLPDPVVRLVIGRVHDHRVSERRGPLGLLHFCDVRVEDPRSELPYRTREDDRCQADPLKHVSLCVCVCVCVGRRVRRVGGGSCGLRQMAPEIRLNTCHVD